MFGIRMTRTTPGKACSGSSDKCDAEVLESLLVSLDEPQPPLLT